jgi:hypothetical protein
MMKNTGSIFWKTEDLVLLGHSSKKIFIPYCKKSGCYDTGQ